ncbi:MAG: hypothetical protein IKQ91_02415 [Oscillospiraceae bacterium]|nr:hypothetical protein [Oscillospiraceae bacterium]
MKKSIRKIGASLLAIGVTAAGVSSIPASAYVPTITRYANFTVGHNEPNNNLFYCTGVLSYTPGSSDYYYCSTTAPSNFLIQKVTVWASAEYAYGGVATYDTYEGRYFVSHSYYSRNNTRFRGMFNAYADARKVNPSNGGNSAYV